MHVFNALDPSIHPSIHVQIMSEYDFKALSPCLLEAAPSSLVNPV